MQKLKNHKNNKKQIIKKTTIKNKNIINWILLFKYTIKHNKKGGDYPEARKKNPSAKRTDGVGFAVAAEQLPQEREQALPPVRPGLQRALEDDLHAAGEDKRGIGGGGGSIFKFQK